MTRIFLGLLISTIVPKFGTQKHLTLEQQPHAPCYTNNQKFNTEHRISTNRFNEPSSVRLRSRNPEETFSGSVYKCTPGIGPSDLNMYNIFSNNRQSDQLRSDYEVWNLAYVRTRRGKPGIQRLTKRNQELVARSKARYTKLVDSPENKPYVLDDDYSLVNYADNWKGLDPERKMRRFLRKSGGKLETKLHHPKRDLTDREFKVQFYHPKKGDGFRGKRYEFNNGRQKSSINHKKVKSHCQSKYDRLLGYFDPGTNHCKTKYTSKKKRVLWGRKRAKVYPKLGPKSRGFLEDLQTRPKSNMAAMGNAWHRATTRNVNRQVFIPIMNLPDSLVRKSLETKIPQVHPEQFQAAVAQKSLPQYIPNTNLNVGLPSNDVALALKPALNQNPVPTNLNPTPSIFFNRPTELINPYENHFENMKNTPLWNARQGPQAVLGSPVGLSNFQNFKIAPEAMQNEQFLKPLSHHGLFGGIKDDLGAAKFKNDSHIEKKFKQPTNSVPVKQTQKVFDTADIVNLLQSALLPQIDHMATTTGLPLKRIPIDKMLDMIAPVTSKSLATTENVTEDPKLIVDATKKALLSLFTTEEPIMESLEDILRRNTDRKIPIVYDIEDAPQLSAEKYNPNNANSTKNPETQDDHLTEPKPHILNRRGLLKKSKTIQHKTVQKISSANSTLTTPWIVLATTENMLYSEMMEMQRQKLNSTRQSKVRKATSKSKMNLLFKNKSKSIEATNMTTNGSLKVTEEPKVKIKRDQEAVMSTGSGQLNYEPVTSELRNGKCACGCHTTPQPTWCCRCRVRPPLELTTKVSCQPGYLSSGSISCPDCHQEFTYKLGLRPLMNG